MMPYRGAFRPVGFLASILAMSTTALAQAPAPAQPAPPPADPAAPPPQPPPAAPPAAPPPAAEPAAPMEPAPAAPMEAAPMEPAPAEAAPMEPAPMEPPPAAAPVEEAPAAAEEEDPLSFMFFADANWQWQTSEHGSGPVPWHRAYAWNAPPTNAKPFFSNNNGFNLSFLGLDISYDTGELAANGSVRFGPSVPIFYAGDTGPIGIDNITAAYATWRPVEGLSLDLGQFGTIFGAEVAESWRNLNYSRGGLYYGFQPFWHTGLKGRYDFNDQFALTGMVVNGVNNVFDEDESPSAALQASIAPNDMFSLAVGGLFAFDGETNGSGFDRFVDVVASLNADAFTAIANFDFNINTEAAADGDDATFWGGSLALGYAFTDMFGIALRGEYLVDSDNILYLAGASDGPDGEPGTADDTAPIDDSVSVITGTLTFDLKPIPDNSHLILRWDNRIESANEDIYVNGDGDGLTSTWFGTVVGMVVTTE